MKIYVPPSWPVEKKENATPGLLRAYTAVTQILARGVPSDSKNRDK
jgi:hypothetical protein